MSDSAQDALFLNSRPSNGGAPLHAGNPLMIGRTALGDQLLHQFRRGGWEGWRTMDNDALLHQNITEHVRPRISQGFRLAGFMEDFGKPGPGEVNGSGGKKSRPKEGGVQADLIVDVSGDICVRWMLSSKNVARCAAMFIATTGDSVLLVEDWRRRVRLDRIEPQFYRWLINDCRSRENGEGCADGGGSRDCRDVPAHASPDEIARHSEALRLGLLSVVDNPDPALMVVRRVEDARYSPIYGATPHLCLEQTIRGWRILWDKGVETKVLEMRWKEIPRETGGVILGYVDRAAKSIFVVDVHPAPADSTLRDTSFTRGAIGVTEAVETVRRRTGGVVTYVGEWRSHPDAMFPIPGLHDMEEMARARKEMTLSDHPRVILIIGENDLMFHVAENNSSASHERKFF